MHEYVYYYTWRDKIVESKAKIKVDRRLYGDVTFDATMHLDLSKPEARIIHAMGLILKRGYTNSRTRPAAIIDAVLLSPRFKHVPKLSRVMPKYLALHVSPVVATGILDEIKAATLMVGSNCVRNRTLHCTGGCVYMYGGPDEMGWAKLLKTQLKEWLQPSREAYKEVWRFIEKRPKINVPFT